MKSQSKVTGDEHGFTPTHHLSLVPGFGGEPIGALTDFCTDFLDLADAKPFALITSF
jgi:hypothetical protein